MSSEKKIFNKYYLTISVISVLLIMMIFYTSSTFTNVSSEKKSVVIYFADNISTAHQKIVDNFNKKYRGKIKVIPVDLPFVKFSTNERKELLTRSLRSKSDRIDVFAVDLIWVKRFAKWSLPLDSYFSKSDLSNFISYSLESCYSDGKLYAIPMYIDISTMFYRDDLLRKSSNYELIRKKLEASITWEEFIKIGMSIPTQQEKFYTFPADEYEGLICSFVELVLSQNPEYFNNQYFDFQSLEMRKSLKLLVDLVNNYKLTTPQVINFKERESYKYFLENDGMFVRGWPSFDKDFRNIYHDSTKEKYIRQVPLPHFKNAKPSFAFGGWNLMISKYTAHSAEALEFINFVVRSESQKILYEYGDYLPVIKHLYDSNYFPNYSAKLDYYKKIFKFGVHRPYWKDYTRVSDILSNAINKVIKKDFTIEQALIYLNDKIKREKLE